MGEVVRAAAIRKPNYKKIRVFVREQSPAHPIDAAMVQSI